MKKIIKKIANKTLDYDNKKISEKALNILIGELQNNEGIYRYTVDSIVRIIAIKSRIELNNKQIKYLLCGLSYGLKKHTVNIKNDEIWISSLAKKSKLFGLI